MADNMTQTNKMKNTSGYVSGNSEIRLNLVLPATSQVQTLVSCSPVFDGLLRVARCQLACPTFYPIRYHMEWGGHGPSLKQTVERVDSWNLTLLVEFASKKFSYLCASWAPFQRDSEGLGAQLPFGLLWCVMEPGLDRLKQMRGSGCHVRVLPEKLLKGGHQDPQGASQLPLSSSSPATKPNQK